MQAEDGASVHFTEAEEAKKIGLTGTESRTDLILEMAKNPKLIQRPLAVVNCDLCLAKSADVLLDWLKGHDIRTRR